MNDGRKRQGQKHQNKTAFKIMFNPLALDTHKKVSFKGLCKRCADQLDWKLKYNKYKKMTELAKCTFCHQKNVTRTYMRACEPCYEAHKVCPKCLEAETKEQIEVKLNEAEQKKQELENERRMNEYVKTLKERSRRTVRRLMEKGTTKWSDELNTFVDEEGEPLALQFRNGFGNSSKNSEANEEGEDDDEFGDGEDSDDEHESKSDEEKEVDEDIEEKETKKSKEKDSKKAKEVQTEEKKEVKEEKQENEEQQEEEEDQEEDDEDDGEESDDEQEEDGKKSEDKPKQKQEVQESSTVPVVPGEAQNDEDWQDVDEEQEEK